MPKSKYRIRTVRTASGATAVQVVCYESNTRKIAKHIGSAKDQDELKVLRAIAKQYIEEHEPQMSLFHEPVVQIVLFNEIEVTHVSHQFARTVLLFLAEQCGLGQLDALYLDLAIMRIIDALLQTSEPGLIKQYFHVSYSEYI